VQSEYQTFLTMLTTELQNQDPTQPLDSSQFTSQLAQFSSLEQQLQTNSYLGTLVNNQSSSQFSSAMGYVGHTVQATGDNFTLDGTGTATPLSFSLPSAGSSATISITNSAGQTVNTVTMSNPTAGVNTYDFDATSASGTTLAAGTYTFSVNAQDANGNALAATTYETGKVTGVSTANGTTNLQIGTLSVPFSQVTQVSS
jgi:flagellar basal-body rod modification protein FlgD